MIARMWHGKVPTEKAAAYHEILKSSGLKDYAETPGNLGVYLLRKDEDGITHFNTLTFWKDYDSIKAFAGDDYTKARYYPEDDDFLLEFEELVNHYDVLDN